MKHAGIRMNRSLGLPLHPTLTGEEAVLLRVLDEGKTDKQPVRLSTYR
jgi:hypothetical protein